MAVWDRALRAGAWHLQNDNAAQRTAASTNSVERQLQPINTPPGAGCLGQPPRPRSMRGRGGWVNRMQTAIGAHARSKGLGAAAAKRGPKPGAVYVGPAG